MTVEDRLRSALRAEAEGVMPGDESWAAIEERAGIARRRRTLRTGGLSVLSIAAVGALVLGLVTVLDNDDTAQRVTVGTQPVATAPTTSVVQDELPIAVWHRTFDDPESAANAFATDYLGMRSPTVVPSASDAEYLVRAKAGRGPFTRVVTTFHNGAWWVAGAASDNLKLTSPQRTDVITSPVLLRGESTSFEATVAVRILNFGRDPAVLTETSFTGGGGSGTLEPFSTTVAFPKPETSRGAIMLFVYSAEDGSVLEATVVPIRFTVE